MGYLVAVVKKEEKKKHAQASDISSYLQPSHPTTMPPPPDHLTLRAIQEYKFTSMTQRCAGIASNYNCSRIYQFDLHVTLRTCPPFT